MIIIIIRIIIIKITVIQQLIQTNGGAVEVVVVAIVVRICNCLGWEPSKFVCSFFSRTGRVLVLDLLFDPM
jgi:hypothetical protein